MCGWGWWYFVKNQWGINNIGWFLGFIWKDMVFELEDRSKSLVDL